MLPRQIEAVHGNVLKLACTRFSISDDPGAGQTIMTGLVIKEDSASPNLTRWDELIWVDSRLVRLNY